MANPAQSNDSSKNETWTVLRNFQTGADVFREGEKLAYLGKADDTGEHSFQGKDGSVRKWELKKGLVDYSGIVFSREGGKSL